MYDVEVTPIINNQKILNDRIMYDGEVSLNFIFASNTQGGINTKKVNIPFNFNIDANGIVPTSNINTNIEIGMQDFIVMPDESIDIKVDLNFSVEYSRNLDINIIENIQPGENRATNPYSMTIYFVKPGDSLWKIAKKFRTTVENIAGVNGIRRNKMLFTKYKIDSRSSHNKYLTYVVIHILDAETSSAVLTALITLSVVRLLAASGHTTVTPSTVCLSSSSFTVTFGTLFIPSIAASICVIRCSSICSSVSRVSDPLPKLDRKISAIAAIPAMKAILSSLSDFSSSFIFYLSFVYLTFMSSPTAACTRDAASAI